MLAVYRLEKLNYELTKLCGALEQAEIPFIPLKCSVLRQYYPEPWMRTSCDIDVLVHEENLKRTISYLTEHLGYSYESQSSHDVSLFSKNRNHIELHYDILGDNVIDSVETVLKTIWDVVEKAITNDININCPTKCSISTISRTWQSILYPQATVVSVRFSIYEYCSCRNLLRWLIHIGAFGTAQ